MHAHQMSQKMLIYPKNGTIGPWKSDSAKKCVTFHLPIELDLKMDDARAYYPHHATRVETIP